MHTFLSHIQFSVLWHGLEQPYNIAVALSAKDISPSLAMVLFLFSTSDSSPMKSRSSRACFSVRSASHPADSPSIRRRQAFATSFDFEIFAVLYYFYCRTVEL